MNPPHPLAHPLISSILKPKTTKMAAADAAENQR